MRKRSKYRPRGVILDTMAWVRNGFRPLTDVGDQAVVLRLKYRTALEALIKGEATGSDVDTLIYASNMTSALKCNGFGTEHHDIAVHGAYAIESMRDRGRKTGRYVCTGPELTAIKEMMELHDAQLDVVRINDLDAGIKLARKKELTEGV